MNVGSRDLQVGDKVQVVYRGRLVTETITHIQRGRLTTKLVTASGRTPIFPASTRFEVDRSVPHEVQQVQRGAMSGLPRKVALMPARRGRFWRASVPNVR